MDFGDRSFIPTGIIYRKFMYLIMKVLVHICKTLLVFQTAESVSSTTPVIESAAGQDGGAGVTFPTNSSAYSGPR